MKQVRDFLNAYEVDYYKSAELGPEVLPHLECCAAFHFHPTYYQRAILAHIIRKRFVRIN